MNKPPKFDLAILGLDYVGLPLGLQFAKSGCWGLGLGIDPAAEEKAGEKFLVIKKIIQKR